jgi:Ca2+/Na+ antiporter
MDITHPGKAMPNQTSRPTIVGHRTVLRDPMMTNSGGDKLDRPIPMSMTGRRLTPPSQEPKESAKVEVKNDETQAEAEGQEIKVTDSVDDTPNETPARVEAAKEGDLSEDLNSKKTAESETAPGDSSEESEPAADAKPTSEAEEKESGTELAGESESDATTEPATAPETKLDEQKLADKKLQEELTKHEAINKLVTDKTYYAPIGQKTRKRSARNVLIWTIFALVLIVVLLDLLIDSGMIKTSIKAPISIFKNKNS